MPKVVSIRFKPVTKVYFFDPHSLTDLIVDDRVIVETARGIEMGTVAQPPHDVSQNDLKGKLKRVIRKATPVDLLDATAYQAEQEHTLEKCAELVKDMGLPMKVLDAEYSFDGTRLLFTFVSEQRVDFRNLVKELTQVFKTRVEMKQVGDLPADRDPEAPVHGLFARRGEAHEGRRGIGPVKARRGKPLEG
jgi:cell fate regulator YaaT (PSP1 superfamily)